EEGDIFAAEDALVQQAQQAESASAEEALLPFEALGSEARFDRVLYDGAEFGHAGEVHVGSEEEMDFLGIPGLLEPDQVRELLRHRQSERARRRATPPAADDLEPMLSHEQLAVLRRELNSLVAAWHHRTGQPHGVTHAALRKECGGPAAAVATADQLRRRIDTLRHWATRKSG
ncbi:MAG TPA: ATP-dependent helicase, partial [Marmoricola sp.]|nr:ATP-dependent helicase [Marmoricola sp.]